ncbi:hypothetical protein D3C76_1693270 [compost metagenome]
MPAGYLHYFLLRQLQLLLNLLLGDRLFEIDMIIGMIGQFMSFRDHPPGYVRVGGDPFADGEEGALGVVLLQHIQNLIRL